MEGRLFVIGDVHGCIDELNDLLALIEFEPGRDRLIFAGDLVAKGPDSVGVIQRAIELGAESVRGNHEERVLSYLSGKRRHDGSEHANIARRLGEKEREYLENTPLYLRFPEENLLVVHAGIDPALPLEEQEPSVLLNVRGVTSSGATTTRAQEGLPWASRYRGEELIVFGHDAIRGLQLREHSIGLDSGCVYGGELSALEVRPRKLYSVPAREMYSRPLNRNAIVRLPICREDELEEGRVFVAQIGVDLKGNAEQALVVRDSRGRARAYRNRCKHLPVPLDLGSGSPALNDDGTLVCVGHGARYRADDGYCLSGPCKGEWLEPLRLRREGDALVLHLDAKSSPPKRP